MTERTSSSNDSTQIFSFEVAFFRQQNYNVF